MISNGNFLGEYFKSAKLMTIAPISDLALDFSVASRTDPTPVIRYMA
jgi:hypothetical protein